MLENRSLNGIHIVGNWYPLFLLHFLSVVLIRMCIPKVKVILYSYLILKKMNERITDS